MRLFSPDDPRPIHFMGVAGAGMSALALMARRRGVAVTGCDQDSAGAADVAAAGASIWQGHDPAHVVGARAVVYTAAVSAQHPELAAATAAHIPVVRRADALHEAIRGGTVIAVAGTHGKTTTTVMTTEALAATGANPTGLVGGRVRAWGGNARLGGDTLFVVEADEYDKAFLSLRPDVAVVTNIEADHLECYGTLASLEHAFAEFAGRARRVLVGADDAGARRLATRLTVPVWTVGTARDADLAIGEVVQQRDVTIAPVTLPDGRTVTLKLTVPGLHNVRNAAMALGAVLAVEGDVEKSLEALAAFVGVGRRFELVGSAKGIVVVDDYAHHPSEVVATLAAARQRYPKARIVAVFQPHLYSRTKEHGTALGIALAAADVAVITEVYAAREQPLAGVNGLRVKDAAEAAGVRVVWVPQRQELTGAVAKVVKKGDVVITLGAGDITLVGPALLALLGGKAA